MEWGEVQFLGEENLMIGEERQAPILEKRPGLMMEGFCPFLLSCLALHSQPPKLANFYFFAFGVYGLFFLGRCFFKFRGKPNKTSVVVSYAARLSISYWVMIVI